MAQAWSWRGPWSSKARESEEGQAQPPSQPHAASSRRRFSFEPVASTFKLKPVTVSSPGAPAVSRLVIEGGVYDDNTSSVQTPVTDSPSRLHHSTSAQAIDLMADGRSPSSLNPNTPDMAGNAKTSSTPSCLRQHPALWPSINNPVSQEQQEQQQLQPGTDNQQQAAAADQHSRQHNINPKPFAFGHGGNRVHPDSSLNVSPLQPNLDAHEDVACSASTLDGRHVPSAAAGHQHNAWVTDASNEPAGNAVPCSPRAGAQMTADSASNDSMHAAARPSSAQHVAHSGSTRQLNYSSSIQKLALPAGTGSLKKQALVATPSGVKNWDNLRDDYTRGHGTEDDDTRMYKERLLNVIDPQKSGRLRIWDTVMLLIILYVAFTAPYQIVFYNLEIDGPFAWNWVVDIIFLIDTIMQFNITYFDHEQQHMVTSRKSITRNFTRGWLITDIISLIPYETIAWGIIKNCSHPGSVEAPLKIMRILRMAQVIRYQRILPRLQFAMPVDYGIMMVAEFAVMTALLSHWIACIWGLLPELEGKGNPNWMDKYLDSMSRGYTLAYPNGELSTNDKYAICLYYTVYTLGSIGYGDVTPATTAERYVAVCIMLTGSYFFGYIIGNITSIVSTRNSIKNAFYKTMDELHEFMDENSLSANLRGRLRHYFHYKASSKGSRSWHALLAMMSPSLRAEVATQTSCQWIRNLRYFTNCEEDFLIELSMSLQLQTFTPREVIVKIGDQANKLYIVRRGVVACEGMIYNRGGVFATDMLQALYSKDHGRGMRRNYQAIALTYADVMVLLLDDLITVLNNFPITARELHKSVTRAVMQQEVRAYSRAVVRLLTGKRSRHARLAGDPNGREQHYYSRLLQLVPDKNAALLQQRYEAARLLDRHFHGSIKPDRVFNNASAAERQRLRMQLQLELNRLPFAHLLVDSDSDDDEGDRSSLTHRSAGGAVIEQHGVVRPEKNTEKPLRKQGSITLGNQSQPVTPNSGMKAIIAGSWDQSRRSSMDASSSKDVVAPQPEHVSPQSLSGKHAPSGGGTTLSFVASGAPDPLTKQTLAGLQLMGKALSQIMEELHTVREEMKGIKDDTNQNKVAVANSARMLRNYSRNYSYRAPEGELPNELSPL
eukprot:jgi/Chrzof1/11064/Cz05g22050.t1